MAAVTHVDVESMNVRTDAAGTTTTDNLDNTNSGAGHGAAGNYTNRGYSTRRTHRPAPAIPRSEDTCRSCCRPSPRPREPLEPARRRGGPANAAPASSARPALCPWAPHWCPRRRLTCPPAPPPWPPVACPPRDQPPSSRRPLQTRSQQTRLLSFLAGWNKQNRL